MKIEPLHVPKIKLWQRILLVGLTGTVPLFVVSLVLIKSSYSDSIQFSLQEQRGIAFQRPLEQLLDLLPRYQALAGTVPARAGQSGLEQQIDRELNTLAVNYNGELGRDLKFTDANLASRKRENARLPILQASWIKLKQTPPGDPVRGNIVSSMESSIRTMIAHAADTSNLILDNELDSYYLMDITVTALPQTQKRLSDIILQAGDGLHPGPTTRDPTRAAIMAAMLRQGDLNRVQRDEQASLSEDQNANGSSKSLQKNLPPAVASFEAAGSSFLALLDRVAAGEPVSPTELAAAGWKAHGECLRLWQTGADELNQLLAMRIQAIEARRLQCYLIIIGTLALAAIVMGLIIRSLLAAHDAELLKNDEEMRTREAQLRAIGDNLPDGMVYRILRDTDGTMRFLYVSAGIRRLTGLDAEAVLRDSSIFHDQIFPEDRPALLTARQNSLTNKGIFQLVVRIRRTDGEIRWMQMSSTPQRLPDGRFVWDGIITDVTEQKLAEQKQKQSEERFSRMFNNSPLPITLSRFIDGTMVDANESFLSMSGFTREELIGRTSLELGFYPGQNERKYIVEYLNKYGHLHAYEQSFRTKSGQLRQHVVWMDVIAIGGEKHILALGLDVTEQKLAERQQKQLEEQLRQTQKLEALGTLAGGIAHDFNNILGAIISFSELTRMDNPDNAELQENLGEVLKASNRATNLVRQILSFSRRQKHERKNLQLAGVIQEALKLLRATLPATIEIQHAIDQDMPDVLANPTQIHQVIMNLCTNAAHAMKTRHGQLQVKLNRLYLLDEDPRPHVELAAGDYVRLTVSDSGCGMDEATLKRIFEPFFTTKGPGEGTGLGLSVVHGIVKEHEGVIGVESEPERGTMFTIYLPARATVTVPELLDDSEIPRGNGERILFVDDEIMLAEVAQKIIRRLGYQPVVFHDAGDAWEAIQKEPAAYDVLISDLTMPVMTGVDLARRALQLRPNLPIILTSGSSGTFSKAEVHEIGIRELMSKPLDYNTLAAALNKVLRPAPKLK